MARCRKEGHKPLLMGQELNPGAAPALLAPCGLDNSMSIAFVCHGVLIVLPPIPGTSLLNKAKYSRSIMNENFLTCPIYSSLNIFFQ